MRHRARVQRLDNGIVQHATWAALLSFAIAYAVIGALIRSPLARAVLDHPNRRSLHATPTPRVGGLGVLAGVAVAWGFAADAIPPAAALSLALLAAASLADDVRGLPVAIRFAAHLLAAGLFAAAVIAPAWGAAAAMVAALALAWMINLYNFMDGADGLAGGMTLFGFAFYGGAALVAGAYPLATFSFAVAAAAAGFLRYNFHPARVFMGDVGSVPLGFLAGAVGLHGWAAGAWPAWFPVLVFSPFIADATLTLAKRAARRERVWQAHFEHYYQRLVRIGWGHRKTALAEYALMAACGCCGLAVITASRPVQAGVLAAIAAAYAAMALAIDRAWRRNRNTASA